MVLEALAKICIERLGSLIYNEVKMTLEVRRELEKLHGTMRLIIGVLEDAEKKAMADTVLHQWVIQLRDVLYDADDIIDEYQTRTSLVRPNLPLLPSLSIRPSIGRRIKRINKKLENANKKREQFQLQSTSTSSVLNGQSSGISRITSPLVESDIVGMKIDEDTVKLVHNLTKEIREGIQVFAITGMGGVGKTTLAQVIYDEKEIADNFPLRAWVCVSKEFTDTGVLRDILSGFRIGHHEARGKTQLEPMLKNAIRDEKFLIILDDVWSPQVWTDLLRNPLQSGKSGSRVLITTRNEGVARGMNAAHIHPVQLMSPEEGWALLCKKVALGGEEEEMEDLEDVGKKIVEKCDGLPLAIKAVGGVLCTKDKTRRAWEEVLKSSAWSSSNLPEGVGGALYLSYEDLPSHLKQCFLYCSLFPTYFQTKVGIVISWISEGLVRGEGDTMPEVIAETYFKELAQRSLLQPNPRQYAPDTFTVHDVLCSLAHFIARDEMLVMTDALERPDGSSSWVKLRRLCVVASEEKSKAVLAATKGHGSLRTLLLSGLQMKKNDINGLIKSKTHLRVFILDNAGIQRLPKSFGNLLQLRYLGIYRSDIKELPETIRNLVNLQCLILRDCTQLRKLPRGIRELRNLRCLSLVGTELEAIPAEVGSLHNLNTLFGFAVNNNCRRGDRRSRDGWCALDELRSLTSLRLLGIQHLERAWTDAMVRRGSVLQDKTNLKALSLICTPSEAGYGEEETERIEEVFEVALCPSPSLEFLHIYDFFGLRYPSWMANNNSSVSSHLQNLRLLRLVNCFRCAQLPPFGKLPRLEVLRIDGASAVVTIGPDFFGCEANRSGRGVLFPKLMTLYWENMLNWKQWEWEEEEEEEDDIRAFPCLKNLYLENCPKLRCLPAGLGHHATRLTNVSLWNCSSLGTLGGISDLPSLESLQFMDVTIKSLPQSFSGGELGYPPQFPTLKKLEIIAGNQVLRRCLKNGPDWPKIQHIPYVYMHDRHRSNFIHKTPSSFNTNLDDDE